jgi:hypothetical protein
MAADRESRAGIPAPHGGVRVKEGGLAIVHKDEFILPAAGSEAVLEPVSVSGAAVVNYYFPVEIVIVGSLPEEQHQEIQARIWEKFGDALDRILS